MGTFQHETKYDSLLDKFSQNSLGHMKSRMRLFWVSQLIFEQVIYSLDANEIKESTERKELSRLLRWVHPLGPSLEENDFYPYRIKVAICIF